jgi:hypothetical protein
MKFDDSKKEIQIKINLFINLINYLKCVAKEYLISSLDSMNIIPLKVII